jgi:hypothetical protein
MTDLLDALNDLISDPGAVKRLFIRQHQWLTKEDLEEITGFKPRKMSDLITGGIIPMWKAPDSNEWRITLEEWKRVEAKIIRSGSRPEVRLKIARRRRRAA